MGTIPQFGSQSVGKRLTPAIAPSTSGVPFSNGELTQSRMYAEAVLKTHVDIPVVVDLDSCAEINVVDISFVRRHRLAQVDADSPRVRCLNKLFTKVYGIYAVPVSLTDNHGTTRCFTV